MSRRNLVPAAIRRTIWALLCAGALLARTASPSGWMPQADAAGTYLVPCDGMSSAQGMESMPRAMAGMVHHHHNPNAPTADHPCAFAGLGLAMAEPLPPPRLLVPSPDAARPTLARFTVAIGRGLAAPPPPATGPPTLA